MWLVLVALLGSPDFRTRERATAQLVSNIDLAIGAVLAGERSGDAEVRNRCRYLAGPWFRRNADKLVDSCLPKGWVQWPWICALDEEFDFNLVMNYRGAARAKDGPPDWLGHSEATRLWVVDRIAVRLPFDEVLDRLKERHREYCRNVGRWVPP